MSFPLTDPVAIVAVLLGIEGLILLAAELPYARRMFEYVPSMFWIYFLPMVAATAGLLPPEKETPLYGQITQYGLPACLVLLLLSVNLRAILRLGPAALGVMLAGSLGILLGAPLVLLIFKPLVSEALRPELWKGLGCLSASWTGGSANMIAVSQIIHAEKIFPFMVVVDTIIPYAWMCMLIILSRQQGLFDRWNRSNAALTDILKERAKAAGQAQSHPLTLRHAGAMAAVAVVMMFLALWSASGLSGWLAPLLKASPSEQLRSLSAVLAPRGLSLILATTFGIALSFTPVRRLESYGASKIGYTLLYFVLASIGATTTLRHLQAAPVLLLIGVVWILIHGAFTLGAARLLRAPMSLAATASQANVGGPASTPVLAEAYVPGLAPVGLLLAVFGNILGTPLGCICASLCRYIDGG